MSKLTPKQQAFCDYYIETANATESYKRAGYIAKGNSAEVNASRLLSNAKIRDYIDERLKQKESSRVASQDEVLEFFTSVIRGEVVERVPVILKTRYEMIDKEPSINDKLRAAEDLAKRYGMFKNDVNLSGILGVTIVDDVDE